MKAFHGTGAKTGPDFDLLGALVAEEELLPPPSLRGSSAMRCDRWVRVRTDKGNAMLYEVPTSFERLDGPPEGASSGSCVGQTVRAAGSL